MRNFDLSPLYRSAIGFDRLFNHLENNQSQSNGGYPPGNDSNLLIVFYVQIMPDDFVMQLHRF